VEIVSCAIVALQKLRCYNGIMNTNFLQSITDEQLLRDLKEAAVRERHTTAQLIAFAEMDARRLYLVEGYSSLFVYCTRCLHLSEHAAYGRIEAARAARKHPLVLELLEDGSVTLTTLCLVANHLTPENHRELLEAARYKSKREVEEQVATLRPLPAVRSLVRKLPGSKLASFSGVATCVDQNVTPTLTACEDGSEQPPAPQVGDARPVIAPLAPERYKVQLTIGRETYNKLRKAQDLLRHVVPNGDPAVVFDRALTLLLKDLERSKLGKAARPRVKASATAHGRHVPAVVRREVWARDDGQCAFVGTNGRCAERGVLEFHHVIPFPTEAPRRWRTCSCVVARTMRMRPATIVGCRFCESGLLSIQLGLDRVERWHKNGAVHCWE
jgi:hypothetical protein